MNEAYGSINDYKETICRLSPQHKTAVDNIEDNISNLSKKREAYKKVSIFFFNNKSKNLTIKQREIMVDWGNFFDACFGTPSLVWNGVNKYKDC